MHVLLRPAATILLLAGACAAGADAPRCRGDDARALAAGAERALARADWPLAARLYGCASARSGDAALAERATRVAHEHAQTAAAIGAARRWLALVPDDVVARRHLATALLRGYDDAAATAEFGRLLDLDYPDRARGYLVLLGLLAEERNQTGAARVMDALAARDPGLAEAQYAASVLWQRADDGARALDAARRAMALRADWRLAELAEVRAMVTAGRTAEALARSAALAEDGDLYSRVSHGWLLLGEERRGDAAALFEALRREGGAGAGDALAGLVAIALDEGRLDEAERLVEEAAQDPQQAETVLWHRGQIAEERGEALAAARHYHRLTSGSRAVPAQLRAWRLLREAGAPDRAETMIDDYLAAAPGETRDVAAGVATLLVEAGAGDEAIALLDRALRHLPDDDLRMARAFLLERLDRVPEAIAAMREVLRRRPQDPDTQNALGYTLVDRGRSIAEGRRLIERALASRPDSYAIQDSMGWALVRAGRLEEGRRWLETAWERSQDPEVAAHLGETYWHLGRVEDARRIWDGALERHPDSRPLRRTIERFPP